MMPRYTHYKVDAEIAEIHRPEMVELATSPNTTVDSLHEWILAKGYSISRTAVGNWLRNMRRIEPTESIVQLIRSYASRLEPKNIERIRACIINEVG